MLVQGQVVVHPERKVYILATEILKAIKGGSEIIIRDGVF